ncbi:MAG: sigma-54 dependent transcriptional regulator [Halothiobacillaceae bacterium]
MTADLILIEIDPHNEGELALWQRVRARHAGAITLVMAARADGETIAEAFRKGAHDVLLTPLRTEETRVVLARAAEKARHRRRLAEQCDTAGLGAKVPIAQSAGMKKTLALIQRVAPTPLPVLLTGETGTGKGVLARHLHALSPRRDGPFLAINCGALAPTLIESELFGHEKGAFTGAQSRRIGLLEAAHGGTLFLDEINSAPPAVQVRLLHFIQEKRFMRVGGVSEIEVDVRLVTASNQPLRPLVETGTFREDLFYRLNVFPIDVPPLRERVEDIPALGAHILTRLAPALGKEVHACGPGVLEALQRYSWPGNVRELENVIQRALVLARGTRIELDDLPPEIILNAPPAQRCLPIELPPNATLREVERIWIRKTLASCHGNQTLAAERLGINPSTLWRKLKKDHSN